MHRKLIGLIAASAVAVLAVGANGCNFASIFGSKPGTTGTVSPNSFRGTVKAEWLTPSNPSDSFRDMKLLDTFGFVDPAGTIWDVPAGYITNGASIPWGLWSIIGGPYDGPYRDAAVIHDYYCEKKLRSWEATHKMFYDAALARGVSDSVASTMYAGLRLGGPRWTLAADAAGPTVQKAEALSLFTPAFAQTVTKVDPGLTSKGAPTTDAAKKAFEELQAWIQKEKPTPAQIEKRVEEIRKQLQIGTIKSN